jgi:hypothetical protein
MKRIILFLVSIFCLHTNAVAQIDTSANTIVSHTISGTILDENNTPLPYVNIVSLNSGKGTISNENGNFSIDIYSLNDTNIIRFQCIGYKTKNYKIENLKHNSIILLSENIYSLDEVIILGTTPNPEKIVKSILQNKDLNYKNITKQAQIFIRERTTSEILKLKLGYNKNNIKEITPETLSYVEKNTPKNNQSYSDVLTNIYFKENNIKIKPIKAVELKKEEDKELKNIAATFKKLFNNTKENEFWRIKTGIIGTKLTASENDSLKDKALNTKSSIRYKEKIEDFLEFATFKNKEHWEFLHKINKYNYEVIGGTSINNEKVYIIDFLPKEQGRYQGRLYISIETSALIRADYKYAPNKEEENKAFGFAFSDLNFSGSIYFDNKNNNYNLRYLSYKDNKRVGIKRKFALQKKKKRLLLNKKLNEIKIDLDILIDNKESIELLIVDHSKISDIEFDNFIEEKYIDVTYVNQFDKNLWKNHTTIEPTQQMKEYKKIEQ